MGVVGAAEPGLNAAKRLPAQDSPLVVVQQLLKGGLPPGQLQLSGHQPCRHLPGVQIFHELIQAQAQQARGEGVPLGQAHQQHPVGQ